MGEGAAASVAEGLGLGGGAAGRVVGEEGVAVEGWRRGRWAGRWGGRRRGRRQGGRGGGRRGVEGVAGGAIEGEEPTVQPLGTRSQGRELQP